MNKEGFQCLSVKKIYLILHVCVYIEVTLTFCKYCIQKKWQVQEKLMGKNIFFVVYWFQVKPFMRELSIPLILTNSTFFLELVSADLVDFVSLLTFQPQWQCL